MIAELKLDFFQSCCLIMLAILINYNNLPACIMLSVLLYLEL